MSLKCVVIVALAWLLLSCGGYALREGQSVEEVDRSTPVDKTVYRQSVDDAITGHGALDELLEAADGALDDGDYRRAAALVERAIRLAPQNGYAYLSLARIHYYQAEVSKSRSFIQRARALAVGDKALLKSVEQFEKYIQSNSLQ